MSFDKVSLELRGDVAVIRLNDPKNLNALSIEMLGELHDIVGRLPRTARALVLTGTGRGFSSGLNLGEGSGSSGSATSSQDDEIDWGLDLELIVNPLMTQLRDLPIPWITAVRGPAAGLGCSLALAADLVVASETAYFLQAFVRIALVPDGGSSHLLVRAIGRVRAMEMMLLGERVPATQALQWGLINRVVPDLALEDAAFELAHQLARGPTRSLELIRKGIWSALDAPWEAMLRTEREAQRLAGRSTDAAEGIDAFLHKRPAVFSGN